MCVCDDPAHQGGLVVLRSHGSSTEVLGDPRAGHDYPASSGGVGSDSSSSPAEFGHVVRARAALWYFARVARAHVIDRVGDVGVFRCAAMASWLAAIPGRA